MIAGIVGGLVGALVGVVLGFAMAMRIGDENAGAAVVPLAAIGAVLCGTAGAILAYCVFG